jgi:HAE1 family hydrophobic/amphiphilic exporter-1
MSLAALAVRRQVLVLMVIGGLLVLGLIAYGRLPVELFPNVQFPFVSVVTAYPGAGPEEVERLITRPLEEQLSSLTNVRTIRSISAEGASTVGIEFALGTDINAAAADVRQRVDLVKAGFPRDAQDPIVQKFDFSALPVVLLGVSGPSGLGLRELAEEVIKPRLERVPGVAAVTVSGGREREIEVAVAQDRLRAEGFTIDQVEEALRLANLNIPAGRLRAGDEEFLVRVVGQFGRVEAIGDLVLQRGDGYTIPLRAVAEVRETFREPDQFTRLNGRDSVGLSVQKQAGANTVEVAEGVRRVVRDLRGILPPGTAIAVARDDSLFIRDAIADVQGNLLLGAALATLVVLLFLHDLRSTVIIALALPAAIVATYIPMLFSGFSLNVLSLLALAIAIGLMVDNAIVVNENINRHLDLEPTAALAAERGAREVELAVWASNLANVAVFIPIAFTRGLVGQFFRQFGLTVVFANLFSILIGFTLTPMLSARWLRPRRPEDHPGRFAAWWDRGFGLLQDRYAGLLRWALGHRWAVVGGAGLLFAASLALVASPLIGKEFFPTGDYGQFQVSVTMPPGTALRQTDRAVRTVEAVLRDLPEVEAVFALVGGAEDPFLGRTGGSQRGQIFVNLVPRERRTRSVDDVMAEVRARTRRIAGAEVHVAAQGGAGPGTAPVQVELSGPDVAVLQRLAAQVERLVARTPGTTNVDTNLDAGTSEVQVRLDQARLAELGLTTARVGTAVRQALVGVAASRYRGVGQEVDIVVRAGAADRAAVERLADLHVATVGGRPVRLGDVATLEVRRGPAVIERKDRQRLAVVSASLLGRPLSAVVNDIQRALPAVALPPGYTVRFGGEAEFQRETFGDMLFALGLGSLLVYMTMAAQFESLVQPFVIMFSLPLASIGTFLLLLLTRTTVSLISLLGIVMLAGIVVNNAILLVEFITQQRRAGAPRQEAILAAARTRLRPILMTALVSIMGGLPVALGLGASGAEWRRPLGVAVLGGMLTSTALTLVVIPVVYTLLDDLLAQVREVRLRGIRVRQPLPVTGGAGAEGEAARGRQADHPGGPTPPGAHA